MGPVDNGGGCRRARARAEQTADILIHVCLASCGVAPDATQGPRRAERCEGGRTSVVPAGNETGDGLLLGGDREREQSCLVARVGSRRRRQEVAQTRRQPFGQHQSQVPVPHRDRCALALKPQPVVRAASGPGQTLIDVPLRTTPPRCRQGPGRDGCLWGPWEWEWPEAWQLPKVPWLACRCLPALPLFDSHAHRLWPNDEQADDNPGRILVRWLAPALECPIGQLPLGIALPGSPADMFHWLFNQRLPPLSRFFHALADPRPLPSSRATLQRPPSLLELPTHPTPLSWSFPQLPKSKKGTWSQLSRLDLPSLTASPGLLHTVPQSSSTASTGSSPASRSPCARLRVLYLPSAILDGLG